MHEPGVGTIEFPKSQCVFVSIPVLSGSPSVPVTYNMYCFQWSITVDLEVDI